MFEVKREYWSCMGETTLKKSKFDQDVANTRQMNRTLLENMDTAARTEFRAQFTATQPPAPAPMPTLPQPLQALMNLIQRPIAAMNQMLQNVFVAMPAALANAVKQAPAQLERAVAQVLSFFFGKKEDKTEEKERRELDEIGKLDIFGETKVEQAAQTNLGGGGGR